jgi:hypothetical protein
MRAWAAHAAFLTFSSSSIWTMRVASSTSSSM